MSKFHALHVALRTVTAAAIALVALAASARAETVSPAFIYGIDNANDIYEVDPIGKTAVRVLIQPSGTSNSLAYNLQRDDLFFIGQDLRLKSWSRTSGTTVTDVGSLPIVANNANNASFYDNAFWFFDFNSNVLNKVAITYSGPGVDAVPSIGSAQTFAVAGMNLPNETTPGLVGFNTNTFGDIAINPGTGMLYASTTRGRFYRVSLADPVNGFQEIRAPIAPNGTDNQYGLQLSFNSDYSTLYGHSYETGAWYTIDLATGVPASIGYSTTFDGNGFRDLGGAAAVPEPSTLALAGFGVAGLAWRLLRRRQA